MLFDRERGRDPGLYYLRVFGDPGGPRPWGWRFGGHHVSLHNLVVDGELVATTPCFLGADPAISPLLGGAVNRPLARVEDLARDLVRSLPPDLLTRAVLRDRAPSDFVTANRTSIAEGDRVIPLAGIWRTERFADDEQQAKLQALSDAIDAARRTRTATTRRWNTRSSRRVCPRPSSTANNATCSGRSSAPTSIGCRARCLARDRYDDDARSTVSTSRGPDRPAPASRTTTGCRARAAHRVGQHAARRQPRPLGVARPRLRLRAGRPRSSPRRPPTLTPWPTSRCSTSPTRTSGTAGSRSAAPRGPTRG